MAQLQWVCLNEASHRTRWISDVADLLCMERLAWLCVVHARTAWTNHKKRTNRPAYKTVCQWRYLPVGRYGVSTYLLPRTGNELSFIFGLGVMHLIEWYAFVGSLVVGGPC